MRIVEYAMKAIVSNATPFLLKHVGHYICAHSQNEVCEVITVDEDTVITQIAPDTPPVTVDGVLVTCTYTSDESFRWREAISRPVQIVLEADTITQIKDLCQKATVYYESRIDTEADRNEDKIEIIQLDYVWERLGFANARSIDKVYLPKGVAQALCSDVDSFLSQDVRQRYKELELVYSRVYMLYGLPGTGKTSVIKALATRFKKRLAVVTMDRDTNDYQLRRAFKKLPKNSFLVIEDVDCLFNNREQNTNVTGITFSGFINAIDGIASAETVIFFTTNKLNDLDDALIRRVDYFVKFDFATKLQCKTMFCTFFPNAADQFETWYDGVKDVQFTTNVLQKFFTKHLFNKNIHTTADEMKDFATSEIHANTHNSLYM